MKPFFLTLPISIAALGCQGTENKATEGKNPMTKESQDQKVATFAGGCFWCMQPPFEKVNGVIEVIAGYTGGHKENPTYEEVSSGTTGHVEAIQVKFDPSKVTYSQLLDVFWRQIDPTDSDGQFVDRGSQYRSVIFYHSEEQKMLAEQSKQALEKSGRFSKPIVTEIIKAPSSTRQRNTTRTTTRRTPSGTSSTGSTPGGTRF